MILLIVESIFQGLLKMLSIYPQVHCAQYWRNIEKWLSMKRFKRILKKSEYAPSLLNLRILQVH